MILLRRGHSEYMFDVVEFVQQKCKGDNFSELGLSISPNGLVLKKEAYLPQAQSFNLPVGKKKLVVASDRLPKRFEHLLQLVRTSFPGVSFQLIDIHQDSWEDLITIRVN